MGGAVLLGKGLLRQLWSRVMAEVGWKRHAALVTSELRLG